MCQTHWRAGDVLKPDFGVESGLGGLHSRAGGCLLSGETLLPSTAFLCPPTTGSMKS